MEKEYGQIKFTETDDGFRVDVKGKMVKDMVSCCCWPFFGVRGMKVSECCPPAEEKK
jgi:hypothetical protein